MDNNSFNQTNEHASESKHLINVPPGADSGLNRVHPNTDEPELGILSDKDAQDVATNSALNVNGTGTNTLDIKIRGSSTIKKVGKKVESFHWNITDNEINTFSKFVHGKM